MARTDVFLLEVQLRKKSLSADLCQMCKRGREYISLFLFSCQATRGLRAKAFSKLETELISFHLGIYGSSFRSTLCSFFLGGGGMLNYRV